MRIVVVGAGVAGLSTALFCARDGHDVVVLERDATPLPASADAAFDWSRRGAPQVRHSHAFLARLRNLLRDELPDVRRDLLAAGATEVGWTDMRSDTLDDPSPQPGDEDLAMLCCRRTTFEWVMRRSALSTERVQLSDGVSVTGLAFASGPGGVPVVAGAQTADGVVRGDVVIDATGRPSRMPSMLREAGVHVDEQRSSSGIVYLSRFYRLRDGAGPPEPQALIAGDLQYVKFAIFRGDNDTFSVTLAYARDDEPMHALRDRGRFDKAAALVPAVKPWVDEGRSEPISGVHYMGGLINRLRRAFTQDAPTVLSWLPVGDAAVCTNPLYGRGCALGMVHGRVVAESIERSGGDPERLACEFDAATAEQLVPWYQAAVAQDAASLAIQRGETPAGEHGAARSIFAEGLLPAIRTDAVVARAWVRTFNLLLRPDTLLADPDLVSRVMRVWNDRDSRPPEAPVEGPSREAFLSAIED